MKLSIKQKEEIYFLSQVWPDVKFDPTEYEIVDFINHTIYGIKIRDGRKSANRLFQAKRQFEITSKAWLEDILDFRVSLTELLNDMGCPYFRRFIDSFRNQIAKNRLQLKNSTGSPFRSEDGRCLLIVLTK
jgi:hypothetical protein